MHILGVAASPRPKSRARLLLEAVLDEASGYAGVTTSVVTLAGGQTAHEIVYALEEAGAVVFGMPVYHGRVPRSLKNLLDLVPRGDDAEDARPLAGKPVAVVAIGASDHHAFALDDLATFLREVFSALVPPGVYAVASDFVGGSLNGARVRTAAVQAAGALVDLQRTITASQSHSESEPML